MTIWDAFEPRFLMPLIAGIALTAACSILSVFIVLKRLAFIGQGISHAGFGGIGLASFLALSGLARDLTIFVFCLATAFLIAALSRTRRVMIDTAIGILLVCAMAVGFLLDQARIPLRDVPWYQSLTGHRVTPPTQWESVLFGNILYVHQLDMWVAVGCSLLVLAIIFGLLRIIVFYAFDETSSRVFGVRATLLHYLLLTMIAAMVVLCMKLLGLILVTALLIVPGAAALMLSRRLSVVLITSIIIGEIAMVGGYLGSFGILGGRFAIGPVVVLVLAALFAAALAWHSMRTRTA